jgi:hypothetical protein
MVGQLSHWEYKPKGATAQASTRFEITTIGSHQTCPREHLSNRYERGVGSIHCWVFEHHSLCIGETIGPRSRQHERAFAYEIEKGVNRLRILTQMPTGFAEHYLRSVKRAASRGKNCDAPFMPLIRATKPAD